jgi:hypothetical protein
MKCIERIAPISTESDHLTTSTQSDIHRPSLEGECGTVARMALESDPLIDWARLTDEQPHALVAGTHFSRNWKLVRKAAGMWAHRHGYRCLTDYDAGSATLSVRFVPREAGWV